MAFPLSGPPRRTIVPGLTLREDSHPGGASSRWRVCGVTGGGIARKDAGVVETLRQTGIEPLGEMPWGAHFCLFHETTEDLLDALVPYFAAGVLNNERCIWAVAEPLDVEAAIAALRRAIPDLDRRLAERAIEIVSGRQWYLPEGRFD